MNTGTIPPTEKPGNFIILADRDFKLTCADTMTFVFKEPVGPILVIPP